MINQEIDAIQLDVRWASEMDHILQLVQRPCNVNRHRGLRKGLPHGLMVSWHNQDLHVLRNLPEKLPRHDILPPKVLLGELILLTRIHPDAIHNVSSDDYIPYPLDNVKVS